MNNRLQEKFKQGKPSVGTFCHLNNTIAVDALSHTGLDYVILDMEHSPALEPVLDPLVMAADARGYSPIVRVRDIQRSPVLKALDVGAHGLIVPYVKTLDQVKQLVEWSKYKPVGDRGMCYSRVDGWNMGEDVRGMTPEEYFDFYNKNTLLLPQCETVEALEIVEQIAAMEGVGGIFVGPLDLSISLGIPLQFEHPRFVDALKRILAACQDNGIISMCFCGDAATGKKRVEQGFNSVAIGLDVMLLQGLYKNITDAFTE